MTNAPEQVVQQTFTQRAVGYVQLLNAQNTDEFSKNCEPARPDLRTTFGQTVQFQIIDDVVLEHAFDQLFERISG